MLRVLPLGLSSPNAHRRVVPMTLNVELAPAWLDMARLTHRSGDARPKPSPDAVGQLETRLEGIFHTGGDLPHVGFGVGNIGLPPWLSGQWLNRGGCVFKTRSS